MKPKYQKHSPARNELGIILLVAALVALLSACSVQQPAPVSTPPAMPSQAVLPPTPTASPVPPEPRLLSVCLGQEPASLFVYGDNSQAARTVLAALYDGPTDMNGYAPQAVILAEIPSLANGGATIEPVEVISGTLVADQSGALVKLAPGAAYLPAGCQEAGCQQAFPDQGSALMDQLVVRFRLLPGITWSDGTPLTSADSVYSYAVAQALSPRVSTELLRYTASYQAVDETTLEWRGIPGYQSAQYRSFFFTPLPQHAWGGVAMQDLLTAEISNRAPLGWGAYMIESWVPGDHITLAKNPRYFRHAEGLPAFDRLVFRIIPDSAQAIQALLAGECDVLDETALASAALADLQALQAEAKAQLVIGPGPAWEHLDFGILPADPANLSLFQSKEVRQAAAYCIDRQALIDQVFGGQAQPMHTYLPVDHPSYAAQARQYAHDPAAGAALLDQAGWVDLDGNPQTARTAMGVPGLPDGTPLEFTYQTISGTLREQSAAIIQLGLAECGMGVKLELGDWETMLAAGPQGALFGRNFQMVQFAWMMDAEPSCFLYTSDEIPGPTPQYSRGWGGANLSGYSNPEFNRLCTQARRSLPETPEYQSAQQQLQAIFAEELPAIPLYRHPRYLLARPDLCGLDLNTSARIALWNIESLNNGDACTP